MAMKLEFINLIIPISNIERVYNGGFAQFKNERIELFNGRYWHDEYLFRDGAMNQMDMQFIIDEWEKLGLKGIVKSGGKKKWKDFCVVTFDGPTLPCDWIIFNRPTNSVA